MFLGTVLAVGSWIMQTSREECRGDAFCCSAALLLADCIGRSSEPTYKGDLGSADLRASWFSFPTSEESPD
jgi:hypothetical protein